MSLSLLVGTTVATLTICIGELVSERELTNTVHILNILQQFFPLGKAKENSLLVIAAPHEIERDPNQSVQEQLKHIFVTNIK